MKHTNSLTFGLVNGMFWIPLEKKSAKIRLPGPKMKMELHPNYGRSLTQTIYFSKPRFWEYTIERTNACKLNPGNPSMDTEKLHIASQKPKIYLILSS
jgi:hypothetical protein